MALANLSALDSHALAGAQLLFAAVATSTEGWIGDQLG